MLRIYATISDLPVRYREHDDAEGLIRHASGLVTSAITRARFPVDGDGMPALEEHLDACREAVVRQVSTWLSTGVSPVTGPTTKARVAVSKSTNGSSVAYASDPQVNAYMASLAAGDALIDWARAPLAAEGLTEVSLGVGGPSRPFMRHHGEYVIDGGEG